MKLFYHYAMLLTLILTAGCQSPPVPPPVQNTVTLSTRNNAYSLLHQLLDEEKDVSKLRFFKRENSDLKTLLKDVSTTSNNGAKKLEAFAKIDPTLALNDYRLPLGEQKTRDDIGAIKQKELLHSSGTRLELTLLLTQIEAMNYGSHLAKIAGENDFDHQRAAYLSGLSKELGDLRDQITDRLSLSPEAIFPAKK